MERNYNNQFEDDFENEYNIHLSDEEAKHLHQMITVMIAVAILSFLAGIFFWGLFGESITQYIKLSTK